MLRIALNGLLARPIRTALTAMAIVLGVATIAAAFTLTDTMSRAADDLAVLAQDLGLHVGDVADRLRDAGDRSRAVDRPGVDRRRGERVVVVGRCEGAGCRDHRGGAVVG